MDINKIANLFDFKTGNSERDNFFINTYPHFDIFTKAKTLSIIQEKITTFNSYMNRSSVRDKIVSELIDGIQVFLNADARDSFDLLPFISFYTSINIDDIDEGILMKPLKKIEFIFKEKDLTKNYDLKQILINTTRIIALSSSYKDLYDSIQSNEGYNSYIELLCNYIEQLSENEIIDDELINLITETLPAISSYKLSEKIHGKIGKEIELNEYNCYVKKMIPLEDDIEIFFDKIKKYRVKYSIIPEDICLYINKFYNSNEKMIRLCNIDLIRNYLIENNIENISVFYDSLIGIGTEGLANSKSLSIKRIKLSPVMFHEATHVIQFNNIENDRNYVKYNYNLLKDIVLFQNMDPIIYNRNHHRYLFEIDANINGERKYYDILSKIGLLTENDIKEKDKLDEREKTCISISDVINIDGYNYEKSYLIDQIIEHTPNILINYPVLQIEYCRDGKRKDIVDILKTMEENLNNRSRTEEEILGISTCIFGDSYQIKDIEETINNLSEYTPQNPLMGKIKNNLISEIHWLLENDELINESKENTDINTTKKSKELSK